MAYTIVNKYIPSSLYSLKAPYAMTPQYITIHNTANDATALNEIAYMTRNKAATSYHVAVDDKHAVQAIPFGRNAWHCGDGNGNGNRKSIGVEICYSKSGGERYKQAEANAIEYVAHVLKQYGWGIDRFKWHRDWSGKNCPHRIFAEGRATEVRDKIAARLKELNGEVKTSSAPQRKEEPTMPDLYKPSTKAIVNSTATVLRRLENKEGDSLDPQWRKKLLAGELTDSDAIGLIFVAIDRGHIVGK